MIVIRVVWLVPLILWQSMDVSRLWPEIVWLPVMFPIAVHVQMVMVCNRVLKALIVLLLMWHFAHRRLQSLHLSVLNAIQDITLSTVSVSQSLQQSITATFMTQRPLVLFVMKHSFYLMTKQDVFSPNPYTLMMTTVLVMCSMKILIAKFAPLDTTSIQMEIVRVVQKTLHQQGVWVVVQKMSQFV